MHYIVGLGNPGKDYENTRHNVGWMVLDYMVEVLGLPSPVQSSKYAGRISEAMLDGEEVSLLYPETFMNRSGGSVKKLVPKGMEEQLIVVYDDVDLPVGDIKISQGKGSGGHNGISSIVSSLGSKNFIRVRVGIAGKNIFGQTKRPKGDRLPKHVLGDFKKCEQKSLDEVLPKASAAVQTILKEGVTKAMNTYN